MTETSRTTRTILIALALTGLAVLIWQTSHVFVIVFGGVVGAAMLRGLADPLARRTGLPTKAAVGIALAFIIGLLALIGWLFGHQISLQADEMRRLVPASLQQLTKSLESSSLGQAAMSRMHEALDDSRLLSHLGLAAGAVLYGVGDLVLIFFLGIYFALDPGEYLRGFLRLIPPVRRPGVAAAMTNAGDSLRKWLLAQLIAMGAIGLMVGCGLSLLHVPLALLLGILAGLLEFIPVLGAILFTIPGVLIAFTQSPERALYVLCFYVAVQQLESNLIVPLLQRWAVRLPPAITLLSVVVGGILLGGAGVVFATPIAVVVLVLVRDLYIEQALEQAPRSGAGAGRHRRETAIS